MQMVHDESPYDVLGVETVDDLELLADDDEVDVRRGAEAMNGGLASSAPFTSSLPPALTPDVRSYAATIGAAGKGVVNASSTDDNGVEWWRGRCGSVPVCSMLPALADSLSHLRSQSHNTALKS